MRPGVTEAGAAGSSAVSATVQPSGVTPRALLAGFLLALLMAGINTYLTLKVGIIEEGTIITMMLFVGALAVFGKRASSSEAALVATMGSAGGSFSFIANFFAASVMTGVYLTPLQMIILPVGTSFLGLLMAIPLRQLYVVQEPLPWPTSKATITAISAVTTEEGKRQARLLFVLAGLAGVYVFLAGGLHLVPEEVYFSWFGIPAAARFGIACSPFILGAGYLIGLRVGLGFLVGGLILTAMSFYVPNGQPHKYIWPGVMFMVTSGLTVLLLNWKTMARAFGFLQTGNRRIPAADIDYVMSPKMLALLALAGSVGMIIVLNQLFNVPLFVAGVMLIMGVVVLNFIATRSAGETAFNPVRVMGVLLQGVCAMFGATSPAITLTGSGAAAGSIDQAGLLVQDNVFGRHFGLSARRQWLAQLAVLIPVALMCAWVFEQVERAYPLTLTGEDGLPAPVAKMWATMAQVFSGKAEFPPFAIEAMWIGGGIGVIFGLIDFFVGRQLKQDSSSLLRFVPHSMGLGIGLIIPITYSFAFFAGAFVLCVVLPKLKVSEDSLSTTAAAGILGEGVVGLVVAILISFGLFGG